MSIEIGKVRLKTHFVISSFSIYLSFEDYRDIDIVLRKHSQNLVMLK